MIEGLKHFELIEKVGGRFRLTALIQRRMLELMQGSRPLIDDTKGKTMIEIAVQEIIEDKITVDDTPEKPFMPKYKI